MSTDAREELAAARSFHKRLVGKRHLVMAAIIAVEELLVAIDIAQAGTCQIKVLDDNKYESVDIKREDALTLLNIELSKARARLDETICLKLEDVDESDM